MRLNLEKMGFSRVGDLHLSTTFSILFSIMTTRQRHSVQIWHCIYKSDKNRLQAAITFLLFHILDSVIGVLPLRNCKNPGNLVITIKSNIIRTCFLKLPMQASVSYLPVPFNIYLDEVLLSLTRWL
jgi:hypothetical protein